VQLYDYYRQARDRCRQALLSDYVFVNLYRTPLGEPMKLHAINELFA
jgi:integrase/recombinase XerD